MRAHHWLACLFSALILTGCAVGPNYHRPQTELPTQFRGAPPPAGTNWLGELRWWDLFQDAALRDLLSTALTNNYDVQAAIARVQQAEAILVQNRSVFFPQLGYLGEVARDKNASPSGSLFPSGGLTTDFYGLAGNASWELDLWGRIRRLNQAARAQMFASIEARRDLQLSVLSQVAQGYFRLLALDAELEIAHRSTNSFGESLRIFSERLKQGTVSKLETSAAAAALASAAATVPELERQIVIQENLVNVLAGRNPGPVPRTDTLLQHDLLRDIPPGLPSELLERRPDIREAEQNLRAANAQIGVAVADFFPRLDLTGLFGQASPALSAFTAGGANVWSVAATATGPLFQGGRLVGQYRQARAVRAEAQFRYQATVLNALQEVSNDLVSVQKYGEERIQQDRAVKAYQVAVQVSRERYIAGRAGYFELLQEQQLLFPSENALVQSEFNQYLAFIQLYQALGGGFELNPKSEQP
ncbi:MAG TPA: efflux transporter outer membrane subunit [Verrucomicrobiae bacterium]|nr:efflux transporter outer membrane subunit [Verrucomicrobiae bacterium]